MPTLPIKKLVLDTLDSLKAVNVVALDVRDMTSITDYMIICSATSNRHAKAMAEEVITKAKANGHRPLGVEGEREAEWILIDLIDVVVHIMQPAVREFYNLEKLWGTPEATTVDASEKKPAKKKPTKAANTPKKTPKSSKPVRATRKPASASKKEQKTTRAPRKKAKTA